MALDSIFVQSVQDTPALTLDGVTALETVQINGTTYLYASGFGSAFNGTQGSGISVFSLDDSGQLSQEDVRVDDEAGGLLQGVSDIAIAQVGGFTFLFAARSLDDAVSVFQISDNGDNLDGNLTPVATVADGDADDGVLALGGASGVATAEVDGTTYLIVTGATEDGVTVFSVDQTGALTLADAVFAPTSSLGGATGIHTEVVGDKTLVFVSSHVDNAITVFELGADGTLTETDSVADGEIADGIGAPVRIDDSSGFETVTVGGTTYLYAPYTDITGDLQTGTDGVLVFSVGTDGTLSFVETEFDTDISFLRGAAIPSSATIVGQDYLFVPGTVDDALTAYRIEANGTLALLNPGVIFDDISFELDGAFVSETVQIDNAHYLIVSGFFDDGISVFEMFDTRPQFTVVPDGTIFVPENSPNGTVVGNLDAVIGSGEADDGVSYVIAGGNVSLDGDEEPGFTINAASGGITVNDGGDLDFETEPFITLTIQAVNDETGDRTPVILDIVLLDGNDAPNLQPDEISTQEDSPVSGNLFANNGNGVDTDDGEFVLTGINGEGVTPGVPIFLPSGAILTVQSNGDFTYDPNGQFADLLEFETDTDNFTYQVTDNENETATGSATVTVDGEDALITVETQTTPEGEGDLTDTVHTFIIRRSGQTDSQVTVSYSISGLGLQGATGLDFQGGLLPSGTVTLAPSIEAVALDIIANGDFAVEEDEPFQIALGDATADLGEVRITGATAQSTIVNDDGEVTNQGTDGKDKLTRDNKAQVFDGRGGNDKANAGGGDDVLFGGAGKDKLNGDEGDDALLGGEGDDKLSGDEGDDVILGEDGDDKIRGGEGDDVIDGGAGDDKIRADDGNDAIFGGPGDDRIRGDDGDDTIDAGSGDDRVRGGDGDDRLAGGSGEDELRGDKGEDTFVFASGDERVEVRDYDPEEDLLDFTGIDTEIATFQELLGFASEDGKDLVFDFGEGDTFSLRKTDTDDIPDDGVLF